jgi:hypothetical protein
MTQLTAEVTDHHKRFNKVAAKTADPESESAFQRLADWVSAAMGRPTNIIIWLILVLFWTVLFAAKIVPADGSFLPTWFTGQGFNFPLNLITTVAELFIGFLVAAAANGAQPSLKASSTASAPCSTMWPRSSRICSPS